MNDYENFASKALKNVSPPKRKSDYQFARPQYPSRRYPNQARQEQPAEHTGVRTLVQRELLKQKKIEELKEMTVKEKKPWKIPFKWKSAANQASKTRDRVAVLYLNIKGEMENPVVLPIHGNMIFYRNKIHEVDPRAFWIFRQGMKMYKFMIVKEIDRRPVSNLDLDEIKRRGDATDSDEFLIKMALRAQTAQTAKQVSKWVAIAIGALIVGAVIFFLVKS